MEQGYKYLSVYKLQYIFLLLHSLRSDIKTTSNITRKSDKLPLFLGLFTMDCRKTSNGGFVTTDLKTGHIPQSMQFCSVPL
jgi:hypothetical protein